MIEYEVFCPAEDWRFKVSGPVIPRKGDELMHNDTLYLCSSARHLRGADGNAKVLVFVRRL